jgi:hypothetical protein
VTTPERPPFVLDEAKWPDPIPPEDFYGPIGDFIRLIEPETEADPAALYLQALAVAGNIIGREAWCQVRDSQHHPNLFVGIVGPTSGARKGLGGDSVRELGRTADSDWFENCLASGIASGEFLIDRVKDKEPDALGRPPEKRLMVFEEELSFLLASAKRETSTAAAVLRSAWDGHRILQVSAKNVGAKATDAHISLIGHITREELLTLLTDSMVKGGLVNRFLWACSKRTKLLPEGGARIDFSPIAKRLNAAKIAPGIGLVERDAETRELWDSAYREVEGVPREGMFGKSTCRGSAQTLRLSLIFALLDGEKVIRAPHLKAAQAVWRFSEASARFIFGEFTGNDTAQAILNDLRNTPRSQSEIYSLVFQGHKRAEVIAAALAGLERAGKVKCETRQTGGRASKVWMLR